MNCGDANRVLAAYADGEVDGLRAYAIRHHLRGCAACATTHHDVLALRTRIRAEVPRFTAPLALRERLRATLAAGNAARPSPSPGAPERWRWLAAGVAAGSLATVLAWWVGTAVLDRRANDDLAAEAVTTHVRATLGNHLVQVASSDQHTVKPWLSARLDYAPPVREAPLDGVVLVGGRIDYLDRHPVAALVYRYREHTIDVFVRPEATRAPPSSLRVVRGFNVAHATGAGMDWLAVSDVNPAALSALVAALAREDAPR